jgi:TetR/AcrR family transcriptional repressor of mexJK operon
MSGPEKVLREGSPVKRAAILSSAQALFLRDGFERTSMDAVARHADVSKRTVYDYYGDKSRLLRGVVEAAAESLLRSVHDATAKHLSDDTEITTVQQLEHALIAFVTDIATTIVTSTDYATVATLVAEQRAQVPELESVFRSTAPEEAIAERLAFFHDRGLLDAPDPLLAADHFNALTTLLAYSSQPDPVRADPDRARRSMIDGVRVFVRAYGTAGSSPRPTSDVTATTDTQA